MCKILLSSAFLFRYFCYCGNDKGACPIIYSFFVRIAAIIISLLFISLFWLLNLALTCIKHRGSEIRHKLSMCCSYFCVTWWPWPVGDLRTSVVISWHASVLQSHYITWIDTFSHTQICHFLLYVILFACNNLPVRSRWLFVNFQFRRTHQVESIVRLEVPLHTIVGAVENRIKQST